MKTFLATVAAAMIAWNAIPALANTIAGEDLRSFIIESRSLAEALDQWAKQSGLQLFVRDWELAKRLPAPRVQGKFSARAALEKLLKDSPMTWAPLGERSVVVREKPPAAPREQTVAISRPSRPAEEHDARSRYPPEEIIVTAQRREERLQDVPISLSVVGGPTLDKSTAEGVIEVLTQVPGVSGTAAVQGSGTQLTVRGVTAAAALFSGSSPIAYYLDSIPFGFVKSAIAPDSSTYDLDRVEVLRGPQGTLYGASALNGVMRVLTKNADLEELEFKARTAISSTEDGGQNYRGDVALNIPLVEGKLAARAVVGFQDFDGWIDKPDQKDFNDARIRTLRMKLNAQPDDRLSLGLSAWLSRGDYGGPSRGDDDRRNPFSASEAIDTDFDAYRCTVGYDFDAFSVTNAISRLDYGTGGYSDFPGALVFSELESDVFTEELTASSHPEGPWRWSIGGAYREVDDRTFQYFAAVPGGAQINPYEWLDRSHSSAVFGEVTRALAAGKFELTAGLRYFEDELRSQEGVPAAVPAQRVNPQFQATTPRLILTWHATRQNTLYASYGEGFRSGFDQFLLARRLLNFPPVKPDTLRNYEIGVKGNAMQGSVSYEAALYYINWNDVQQSLAVVVEGVPRAANMNGGSASGMGLDFGIAVRPAVGLELAANISWNDLTFDSDVFSGGELLFASGERLNSSPEWTANASASYRFPLGDSGFEGLLSGSASYTSEQKFVTLLDGRYSTVGDTILIGHASFAVRAPSRWTASLFVDNVGDENGSAIRSPLGVPAWSTRVRPRTMGLQLDFSF
jgi:outer membrane receptor protein involved in Fe transport